MANSKAITDRIAEEFSTAFKDYVAFDRTLDALAALSFVLHNVKEIVQETNIVDFTPKLVPIDPNSEAFTPDGLIVQKPDIDFILELKTSWNNSDIAQVTKYAKSHAYRLKNGTTRAFNSRRCVLLGYQNPPGEGNLDKLFDAWQSDKFDFPLVIFRYSLEQGSEGDRIYFSRVAYGKNGQCPLQIWVRRSTHPADFQSALTISKRIARGFTRQMIRWFRVMRQCCGGQNMQCITYRKTKRAKWPRVVALALLCSFDSTV